jgi:integrase
MGEGRRRAGLPKGTRYRDLRHTFPSALIASGCSVKAIQVALGHESASVTLDTYSHLWPSDDDRTRAAVDAFLSRPEPRVLAL